MSLRAVFFFLLGCGLVGSVGSVATPDVSLHTLCTGREWDVLTKPRDKTAVIQNAELQSRPGTDLAELIAGLFEVVYNEEAAALKKYLTDNECVELRIGQALSDRGYAAIVRVLTDNMAPITTRYSFMYEANFTDAEAITIAGT